MSLSIYGSDLNINNKKIDIIDIIDGRVEKFFKEEVSIDQKMKDYLLSNKDQITKELLKIGNNDVTDYSEIFNYNIVKDFKNDDLMKLSEIIYRTLPKEMTGLMEQSVFSAFCEANSSFLISVFELSSFGYTAGSIVSILI